MNKSLISVCIPVFNEVGNVERLYRRVCGIFDKLDGFEFELIFTDNNSDDGTYSAIQDLAAGDGRVKAAKFLKNHGYQNSILAGYFLAKGECVIQLDCDLQDPPELIPKMLQHWQSGYKVVYGIRRSRKESWILNAARKIFYRVLNWLSDSPIPLDTGDFRLVDRIVIDTLRVVDDRKPYLRGSIHKFGFKQIGLPYDRDRRQAGQSKFTIQQLTELAVDGVVSNSVFPLILANYVAVVAAMLAIVWFIVVLIGKLVFMAPWPAGFATLVTLSLVNVSLSGFFFGIFGVYFARAMRQLKQEPLVIIEEGIGLNGRRSDTNGRLLFLHSEYTREKSEKLKAQSNEAESGSKKP